MIGRFVGRCVAGGRMPGAAWSVADTVRSTDCGVVGAAQLSPTVEPLDRMTPFDLASLTKPLSTALLLLLARRSGRLSLMDSAERWLPEWRGREYADRTLLELALHRSGLPAWVPLGRFSGLPFSSATCPASAADRSARLTRALVGIGELASGGPQGKTLYSDLGYIALGAAIERAAGGPLDVLFDRQVANPLGLRYTGFPTVERNFAAAAATEQGNRFERQLAAGQGVQLTFRESIPRGQVHDGNAFLLGGVAGHAGLFGTVDDVAQLGAALLDPESPLGLTPEDRRTLLVAPAGGDRTCGFEIALATRAARGILEDRAPGHLGFTGGSIWLLPRIRGVAVLLAHRVHPHIGSADFQQVRRGFHRLVARRWRASS